MVPVKVNRLAVSVRQASKPPKKNHLRLVGGNRAAPEQTHKHLMALRKARAYMYRQWDKLPEHKQTRRAWSRIQKRSEIKAQYTAVSGTDNFVGSIYGYYDSEFLDGIDDSAQPGVGIAAIPFRYQCVAGVGKYIALAGYSSQITYEATDGADYPNHDVSVRYRDAITEWTITALPATGTLYDGDTAIASIPHTVAGPLGPDGLMFVPAGVGTETFSYTCVDITGTSNEATVTLETTAATQEEPGAAPLPDIAHVPSPTEGDFVEGVDYWIDNSHPSASDTNVGGLGSPTLPRATLPVGSSVQFAAGTKIFIRGGVDTPYVLPAGGTLKWFLNGTAATAGNYVIVSGVVDGPNKPLVQAANLTGSQKQWRYAGAYAVFEGLRFENVDIQQRTDSGDSTAGHTCVRHSEVFGQQRTTGTSMGNITPTRAIINCHIHDNGIIFENFSDENDVHGVQGGTSAVGLWVYDCLIHDNAGDSIQINGGNNINLCRDKCHSEGENAIDIKRRVDHIISRVDCWDFRAVSYASGSGSDGTAIVYNVDVSSDPPDYIWCFNSRIWDMNTAVRMQCNHGFVVGCHVWHQHSSVGSDVGAFVLGNTGTAYRVYHLINNTIEFFDKGVHHWGGAGTAEYEYIFAGNYWGTFNQNSPQPVHYRIRDGHAVTATSLMDYNVYKDPVSLDLEGATNFSELQALGFDLNSVENAGGQLQGASHLDFTPQESSLLIGANVEHPTFDLFEARYSGRLSTRVDIYGTARPDSGATIGAVEHV